MTWVAIVAPNHTVKGCHTGFDPVPTESQSVMQSHYTNDTILCVMEKSHPSEACFYRWSNRQPTSRCATVLRVGLEPTLFPVSETGDFASLSTRAYRMKKGDGFEPSARRPGHAVFTLTHPNVLPIYMPTSLCKVPFPPADLPSSYELNISLPPSPCRWAWWGCYSWGRMLVL